MVLWRNHGKLQSHRPRGITRIHSCVVILKQGPTDPTLIGISLMWNYDPLSQILIPKESPFYWPTKNTYPFHTPLHTPSLKIDPNHCFLPLPEFTTLIAVRMSVPPVWKPYHFPGFFFAHRWQHACLARVPPPLGQIGHGKVIQTKLVSASFSCDRL